MSSDKKAASSAPNNRSGKFADLDAVLMTWNIGKVISAATIHPEKHLPGHMVRQHVLED